MDGISRPIETIAAMAAAYVREMKTARPSGPYNLCGGSFGGLVALEMAGQLRAAGDEVSLLALFDTIGPESFEAAGLDESSSARTRRRLKIIVSAGPIKLSRVIYHSIRARLTDSTYKFAVKWYRLMHRPLPYSVRHWLVDLTNKKAVGSYNPETYAGNVTLIRLPVSQDGMYSDPALGWGSVITGRLEIVEIPDAGSKAVAIRTGIIGG